MSGALVADVAIDDRVWRALYPADLPVAPDIPPTMLDAVRETMARHPHAPAARYFDGELSYAALDDLSGKLAAHWRAAGLAAGDRVAVILQNVPQFAVAVIAAWKLGLVPVTMNPMYRTAELAKLFADCAPRAILCHDDHHGEVARAAAAIECVSLLTTTPRAFQSRDDARVLPAAVGERDDDLLRRLDAIATSEFPVHRPAADDVALLLYTSGTTGTPKGAMLTHRNLATNAAFCRDWMALDAGSRIFGVAPLFHITGFACNLCAAFLTGASIVMTYRFAPEVTLDALREHRPTFIIAAITAYIALMQARGATAADFAGVTHVFTGGAPIPPTAIEMFARNFGKALRSCYGMTETTAPAIFAPPEGAIPVDRESGALAIGLPIPGTEALIVGEDRRPLPIGEAGELAVRGPHVMKGYWRKPEETAEVLVDGWMHTGDVAFRDEAGWFYLVDRKKDMICASGFKVWPREVEDVLYQHHAVREAAVVGAPDDYRGETVLAFVSLGVDAAATPEALIAWCRERLAAYKAPRRVIVMDDLPKTVSGKIMRAELRKTAQTQLQMETN